MTSGSYGVCRVICHPLQVLKKTSSGKLVIFLLLVSLFFLFNSLLVGGHGGKVFTFLKLYTDPDSADIYLENAVDRNNVVGGVESKSIPQQTDKIPDVQADNTIPGVQAAGVKPKSPPQKTNRGPSVLAVKPKSNVSLSRISKDRRMAEQLPLFHDLYSQEAWPEISREGSVTPDQVTSTVHYVWCQSGEFQFQHYLGVLSVIRLLQPLKLVFHYGELPHIDGQWYHVWFWELKQSFASLELRELSANHKKVCGTNGSADIALDLLAAKGGLYIAPLVVLTRFPTDITRQPFWMAMAASKEASFPAVLFSLSGFDSSTRPDYMQGIQAQLVQQKGGGEKGEKTACDSVDKYNQHGGGAGSDPPCLVLTNQVRPKDVMTTSTAFAELARWLYYGIRRILEVKLSSSSSIPRIGHMTWLAQRDPARNRKFKFTNFLSILSALHVAGLQHLYVHGDYRPQGEWWERLKGENVTFVPIEAISHIFQQSVGNPAHRSDVLRPHLLRAYGGVYMDTEVFWASRLPDDLLRYPTVACPDWPSRGDWPESLSNGLLMSQSDSPWLRHYLKTMRSYWDRLWVYNSILMAYRTYERYPESLYIDRYLQVICFRGKCHPTWHDDYIRDLKDPRPPRHFDWREGRAFHFTGPIKPEKSLTSPDEIRKGKDMFAELGRHILTKAGRGALIGQP